MSALAFDHLSVSHANDFIERRPKWYASRIMGVRFPGSPDMHRGTAVEFGVNHGLSEGCVDTAEAVALATAKYDELAEGMDGAEVCREDIGRLVIAGIDAMAELIAMHGPVAGYQEKIEHRLFRDGWPWVGFTDFRMADGTIIDLKVTKSTKSTLPGGWGRQLAFYSHALDDCRAKALMLVPLKTKVGVSTFDLPETMRPVYIGQLRDAERAIATILDVGADKIAAAFMPDPDSYFLADPESRRLCAAIWGLAAAE